MLGNRRLRWRRHAVTGMHQPLDPPPAAAIAAASLPRTEGAQNVHAPGFTGLRCLDCQVGWSRLTDGDDCWICGKLGVA